MANDDVRTGATNADLTACSLVNRRLRGRRGAHRHAGAGRALIGPLKKTSYAEGVRQKLAAEVSNVRVDSFVLLKNGGKVRTG